MPLKGDYDEREKSFVAKPFYCCSRYSLDTANWMWGDGNRGGAIGDSVQSLIGTIRGTATKGAVINATITTY